MGKIRRWRENEAGATMVEFSLAVTAVLILLGGMVDFLFAFWQWNSAMKAVEIGARIAAVSNPVAGGLMSLSTAVAGGQTGQPFPVDGFGPIVCDGAAQACCLGPATSCAANSSVAGITYDATAMNWIVYGRGATSCVSATAVYNMGMCQILTMTRPALSPANVMIEYRMTGLGYQGGAPTPTITLWLKNVSNSYRMTGLGYQGGAPTPTITLWLKNVSYSYFFVGGLLKFANLAMPSPKTSITGEDVSSSAPVN
jgi:hypothetical protein